MLFIWKFPLPPRGLVVLTWGLVTVPYLLFCSSSVLFSVPIFHFNYIFWQKHRTDWEDVMFNIQCEVLASIWNFIHKKVKFTNGNRDVFQVDLKKVIKIFSISLLAKKRLWFPIRTFYLLLDGYLIVHFLIIISTSLISYFTVNVSTLMFFF